MNRRAFFAVLATVPLAAAACFRRVRHLVVLHKWYSRDGSYSEYRRYSDGTEFAMGIIPNTERFCRNDPTWYQEQGLPIPEWLKT